MRHKDTETREQGDKGDGSTVPYGTDRTVPPVSALKNAHYLIHTV